MNNLKLVLGISLSTIGLVGATVGASLVNNRFDGGLLAANAEVPTNTRRIWIRNNDNWWTDNDYYAYAWVGEGGSGNDTTSAAVHMVLTDYYYGLGYVDITLPNATSGIKVIIRDGGTSWGNNNQTVTVTLGEFGTGDVIHLNSGVTWNGADNRNDRNASVGTTDGFSAQQLKWILINGGIDTCSSANTNGYNAYPQMNVNFFEPTNVDLTGEIVSDTYSVQDYIDGMYARYSA